MEKESRTRYELGQNTEARDIILNNAVRDILEKEKRWKSRLTFGDGIIIGVIMGIIVFLAWGRMGW